MRLVVVSPHPDDAAIACGATIIEWPGEKYVVYCKTYPGRTQEAKNACGVMGATPMFLKELSELQPMLKQLEPDVVLAPNPRENHYWHKEVAGEAAKWKKSMWQYEVWAPFSEPNKAVWFGEKTMKKKMRAIKAHKSQCIKTDWPNAAKAHARWRAAIMPKLLAGHGTGATKKAGYCEAFKVIQ